MIVPRFLVFPSPCSRTVSLVHAPAGPEEHNWAPSLSPRPVRRPPFGQGEEAQPHPAVPGDALVAHLDVQIERDFAGAIRRQGQAVGRSIPWGPLVEGACGAVDGNLPKNLQVWVSVKSAGLFWANILGRHYFLGSLPPGGVRNTDPQKKRDARKKQKKQVNAKNRQTTRKLHLKSLIPRDVHFLI